MQTFACFFKIIRNSDFYYNILVHIDIITIQKL